jgi:hypothetical protein
VNLQNGGSQVYWQDLGARLNLKPLAGHNI